MKVLKLVSLTLVLGSMILAQAATQEETGTIKGKITDKVTGEGIPGVSVTIVGTSLGAAATFDGTYVIVNVPVGIYSLEAKTVGYTSHQVDSVKVKAGRVTKVDFSLESLAMKVEDITVTAVPPAINKYTTTTEVHKDADEIAQMPVDNVSDVLRTNPGFVKQDGKSHARGGRSGEISYMVSGIEIKDHINTYNLNQDVIHYPPYAYSHDTEEYDRIYENEFLDALSNPLSTFSIDVDKASYTNSRRYINHGQLPPADAVRIEEFINYFNYDYPQPDNNLPFSIITEVSECPWNKENKLLHIGLQGKNVPLNDIPPGNLVFLLDVSGSMTPADKLPLLKSAFKLLVDKLRDSDRVAIVVYAGASGLVLPSTPGNQMKSIIDAIDNLYPGGSTAGAAGIKLAYEIAKKNFIKGGNNRVILATDGDFNVGVSSTSELVRMIEEKREQGIFLTVLGFGTGNLKDSRMEQLADKGNGNYAYIDNIMEGKKVLVSELGGTLYTIAKDVKIQLEFNPAKILAYRLIGYENRMLKKEDFNDDKKDAGEIGSGHSVTAIYEIIPPGEETKISDVDPLKYQRSQIAPEAYESAELLTIKFRYKKPDGQKSNLITVPAIDQNMELAKTCDNFRFSAAVAEFGMLLRDSKHKAESNFDQVIILATDSRGEDAEGYRAEFIKLVKMAKELSKTVAER